MVFKILFIIIFDPQSFLSNIIGFFPLVLAEKTSFGCELDDTRFHWFIPNAVFTFEVEQI